MNATHTLGTSNARVRARLGLGPVTLAATWLLGAAAAVGVACRALHGWVRNHTREARECMRRECAPARTPSRLRFSQ